MASSLEYETYYKRTNLMPLAYGPWLVPKPPTPVMPLAVLSLWALLVVLAWPSPMLLWLVSVVLALPLLFYVAAVLHRLEIQVCPKCLQRNTRGATRCYRCHFQAS